MDDATVYVSLVLSLIAIVSNIFLHVKFKKNECNHISNPPSPSNSINRSNSSGLL